MELDGWSRGQPRPLGGNTAILYPPPGPPPAAVKAGARQASFAKHVQQGREAVLGFLLPPQGGGAASPTHLSFGMTHG